MELDLKIYSALCETEKFIINGVDAQYEDFGLKYDECPEEAEDYCCGNMVFTRKEPTTQILQKYNITLAEYDEICYKLEEKLSFGGCGLCS